MRKLICILFALLIASSVVVGLGVTPTRKTFETKGSGSFTLMNEEGKDLRLLLTVKGDSAKYITLKNALVSIKASENSKSFDYDVSDFKLTPGSHKVEIVAIEVPENAESQGSFVGATAAVQTEVILRVPYPGKYAEASLDITSAKVNDSVTFTVPVSNFGEQDLSNVKAQIDILGPTNEVIATIKTDEKGIKSKSSDELKASWKAKVNPGQYSAKLTLNYDSQVTQISKNFYVGNMFIAIKDVSVRNFKLGDIAKLQIQIQNEWNQAIDEIYAQVQVFNDKGDLISDFKSSTASLKELGSGEIMAYWDTNGISEGRYKANFIIHYGDKKTEAQLPIVVSLSDIKFSILSGNLVQEKPAGFKIDWVPILVIILVLVNIFWFFYLQRRKVQ